VVEDGDTAHDQAVTDQVDHGGIIIAVLLSDMEAILSVIMKIIMERSFKTN
jgi:hypothetical protein